MIDQSSEEQPQGKVKDPIDLLLEVPGECNSAIRQKGLELNLCVNVKNNSLRFRNLTIDVSFDALDLKPHRWIFSAEQLETESSIDLELKFVERMDGNEFQLSIAQPLQVKVTVATDGEELITSKTLVKVLPPAKISADNGQE